MKELSREQLELMVTALSNIVFELTDNVELVEYMLETEGLGEKEIDVILDCDEEEE